MQDDFESNDATLITSNKVIRWIAASPLFLVLPSIVAGALVSPRFFGATILSLIFGTLLSLLAFVLNPFAKRDASGIIANQEGLTTRAGAKLARNELSEGVVVPDRRGGVRVRLSQKGARLPVDVEVPSKGEGTRLLKALGLDAAHSVVSFFGMSRVYASVGGFFANTALLVLGPVFFGLAAAWLHFPPLGFAALLVGVFAYVSFFMPMRLKIGGDGMIVSWYGRKRFIPYADVEGATRYAWSFGTAVIRGIRIRMRSGEEMNVPLSYGYWGGARTEIAEERIHEAMDAYAQGGEGAHAAMLARGERTASEWILALRRIGSGANAGPRTAPIASDTLWRIVESASETPTVRAAAAVALASGLDHGDRARLASIAEGTTAPKLRIALNAASAEEDEAAIAEALSELDAEERASRR